MGERRPKDPATHGGAEGTGGAAATGARDATPPECYFEFRKTVAGGGVPEAAIDQVLQALQDAGPVLSGQARQAAMILIGWNQVYAVVSTEPVELCERLGEQVDPLMNGIGDYLLEHGDAGLAGWVNDAVVPRLATFAGEFGDTTLTLMEVSKSGWLRVDVYRDGSHAIAFNDEDPVRTLH